MRADKTKFHNRFDIVVTNVGTGEVELRNKLKTWSLIGSIQG